MFHKEVVECLQQRESCCVALDYFGIKQHSYGSGQEEEREVNLGQKFIVQLQFL